LPWAIAGAATLAALAAIGLGLAWRHSPAPDRPLMHIRMDLGPDAVAGARLTAALSPDGGRIAYVTRGADGRQLLTIGSFDQSPPVVLAGTDGADDPSFSPDGQWVGYRIGFRLMKVPVQGGEPVTIATAPAAVRGVAWGEDGKIVFGTSASGLYRVSGTGGKVQPLTDPAKSNHSSDRWPQFLPGEQTILYSGSFGIWSVDDSEIVARNLRNAESKTIYRGGYNPRYVATGHLLFLRQGSLFGVRFDPSSLKVSGEPVKLVDGVSGDVRFGGGDFSLSRTGALLYHAGKSAGQGLPVVSMDSSGQAAPIISRQDLYFEAKLSPDGRFLAVVIAGGNGSDISVWDIGRQVMSPLTSGHNGFNPVWMADSRHLIFATRASSALWWARADGGSEPRKLLDSPEFILPSSVSTDSRRLAYYQVSPGAGNDLWTLPIDTSDPENPKFGTPEPFLRSPVNEDEPSFSADGRWLAYRSDESKPGQIYVRPFPPGPGKWQISRDGGWWPTFSRDGKQLFYLASDGHLMVVDYQAKGDLFAAGTPRAWTDTTFNTTLSWFAPYDLSPDAKRVLFVPHFSDSGDKGSVHVELVLNFFDELRRRIP
jgi:serine/threonine-protein kinase